MSRLRRTLAVVRFNRARSVHATDAAALVVLAAGLVIELGLAPLAAALLPAVLIYWLGPLMARGLVARVAGADRRPVLAVPLWTAPLHGPRLAGIGWLCAWSIASAGWWPIVRAFAIAAAVYEAPRHVLPLVFGRRVSRADSTRPIRHILLQRSQVIGDLVNATPCIEAIKRTAPGCRVSVLCREATRELLEGHPDLETVIVDPTVRGDRVAGGRRTTGLARLVAAVRDREFDLLLSLWDRPSSVYGLAALLARVPVRSGNAISWGGWMLNAGVVPREDLAAHEVEHTLRRVAALGFRTDSLPRLSIVLQPRHVERARALLADSRVGPADFLVGLSPATSGANRRLEPDAYAGFVDRIRRSHGARTILFGGPDDRDLTRAIGARSPVGTIDMGGQTSVGLLAALVARCRVHVGGDSGPTHVAAGVGVPCVVISPAKSQKPLRWGPWMTPHRIVRKRSGCRLRCAARECGADTCVAAITVEDICTAFEAVAAGDGIVEPLAGRRYWAALSLGVIVHVPGVSGGLPTRDEADAISILQLLRDAGFVEILLACDDRSPLAQRARGEGFDVRAADGAALFDAFVELGGGVVCDFAPEPTPPLRRAMWLAARFGSRPRRMVADRTARTAAKLTDELLATVSSGRDYCWVGLS